jgi:hypothetical protein
MTDNLEEFWRRARVSEDVRELARIGNVLLDACTIDPGSERMELEQFYLARTVWIAHRIEFLNIAARMKFYDFKKLAPTNTVPVRGCNLFKGNHPPHTWELRYDVEDNKSDELYWCTGVGTDR